MVRKNGTISQTYIHEVGKTLPREMWDLKAFKSVTSATFNDILERDAKSILKKGNAQALTEFLGSMAGDASTPAHPITYPFTDDPITKDQLKDLIMRYYKAEEQRAELLSLLNVVAGLRNGKPTLLDKQDM